MPQEPQLWLSRFVSTQVPLQQACPAPGQELALHVHTPFWQVCPVAQLVHVAPFVPQALLLVPGWHVPLESQQPL